MMPQYHTSTIINGEEVPITVGYSVSREYAGTREQPPEPAELSIDNIVLPDGRELGLPDEDMEKLEEQIWDFLMDVNESDDWE